MIGFRYPVQGLQPFTKSFGQPLHEPDVQDFNFNEVHQHEQSTQEEGIDPKLIASQIEKSLGFSYDSDGDESDVSMPEDTPEPLEDNSQFLAEHTDILPADAPIDTINTLKALKYHIETSENRCFTNLERQLLATIVQHGIFNANKEDSVSKEDDVHKSSNREANATSSMISIKESDQIVQVQPLENTQGQKKTKINSDSQGQKKAEINSDSQGQKKTEINSDSQGQKKTKINSDSQGQKKTEINSDAHGQKKAEINSDSQGQKKAQINSDVQLVSRKALLPTPGSYEEVSHVLMENEAGKNFSRPTLPIEEQRRMSKAVKSLKINEKLLKIQNSYHPDDEPTLELLESMTKRNEEESAYDDLLKSYSKTKSDKSKEKEPKYKSKTKILPPPDFLKRQERHYETRHERPQQDSHGSNRRVVRREDYQRENKEQGYESGRRRVKLQYREDVQYDRCSSRDQPIPVSDRKRKKIPDVDNNEATADDPKEKAVDILASLITQQFLSKMTEDTQTKNVENSESHPETSVVGSNQCKESPHQSADSPPRLAPLNPLNSFQLPPFISSAPQAVSTAPSILAPLPIMTAPMMGHPGLIDSSYRRNLITIDCNNRTAIKRAQRRLKRESVASKIEPDPPGVSKVCKELSPKLKIAMNPEVSNTKVVVIQDDIEEGEIS